MKMLNNLFAVFFLILLTLIFAKSTFSAYLLLTRIGTLSTAGLSYTTWSVTGPVPDISGTATPSAMVAVTVNAITATTSAAVNGVWVSRPTNIVTGSNSVSIASGNEVISFILNYTPSATPTVAVVESTASALPETGGYSWPVFITLSGIAVFVVGRKIKDKIEDDWNI